MELLPIIIVTFCIFLNCVHCLLKVNVNHVTAAVGEKPDLLCYAETTASFLLLNPLKWELHPIIGSPVNISDLSNVFDEELKKEFSITLTPNDTMMSFQLVLKQGIQNKYDGKFRCAVYNKTSQKVIEAKDIEIHVLRMFDTMEFSLGDSVQTQVGEPALPVDLLEGDYMASCKTKGSNPKADVKIYLDDQLVDGSMMKSNIDQERKEPPRVWNVENELSLMLKPDHSKKVLKCVAMINNDYTTRKEISYLLDIQMLLPEITCSNTTAVMAEKYVELKCDIKLKDIKCSDERIVWEDGNTGPVSSGGQYKITCESISADHIQTKFRIDVVGRKDFTTQYFVVYKADSYDQRESGLKVAAVLYEDSNGVSSLHYGMFLLCAALLGIKLLV